MSRAEHPPVDATVESDHVEPRSATPVRLDVADLPEPADEAIDQERSSATKLVWNTGEGTFAAELSLLPKWFERGDTWREIDVSLEAVPGSDGRYRTSDAQWSAEFAPIEPGSGGVSVVAEDGSAMSWRPSAPSGRVEAVVAGDGLSVTYPEVWPGVDLRYQLSTIGVREEMVLSGPGVATSFDFDVDQRLVRDVAAERAVAEERGLPEAQRRVHRFALVGTDQIQLGAPRVVTAGGMDVWEAPVSAEATERGTGSRWSVGVDSGWVKAQPAEVFPLVLDPDVLFPSVGVTAEKWLVMRAGTNMCGGNYGALPFCWPRNGNAWFGTDVLHRTMAEYRTQDLLADEPLVTKTVHDAALLFNLDGGGVTSSQTMQVRSMSAWNWSHGTSAILQSVPFTTIAGANVTSNINKNQPTRFAFRGPETTGAVTWKSFTAGLFVTWSENYTPVVDQPEVPLVVTTTSPSIKVSAVDGDSDTLTYLFQVSRSPGFEAGTIAASVPHGPTSARTVTKTIPDLLDGTTYYVRVRVTDQAGHASWSTLSPFHVNQRLGGGQAAPTDEFGPVTVNLATGNVATGVSTPQYPVVGGSLGASFTYNSKDTKPAGVLPERWTMSGVIPEAEFVSARVNTGAATQGGSVTLTTPDGGKFEYHRVVSGSTEYYKPIVPTHAVLTVDASNVVRVETQGGVQYEFAPAGTLNEDYPLLQVRQIADILNPGTPTGTWSGNRLQSLNDPVSGQSMTVTYGAGDRNVSGCPEPSSGGGFLDDAPVGMVCRVSLPGGQETELFYTDTSSAPRLSRIENPGGAITDFEYGTGLDLISVRTASAADVLAAAQSSVAGLAWADADDTVGAATRWHLTYTGAELGRIWSPVPGPAEDRLWKDFDFDIDGGETTVTQSGAPSDYTTVKSDDGGRPETTETPTPSGTRVVTNRWDTLNEETGARREVLVRTSDSATGLRSTTKHDSQDWPIEQYGPAPISAFAADDFPASGVPKTTTRYDEGLTGLSVRGWDNTDMAGAPVHASLNFENSNGLTFTDWASGAPAGLPSDGWSARMTGDISFGAAGTYNFQVWTNVGYRVWIGDQLILDQWADPDTNPTGWIPVGGAGTGSYSKSPEGSYTTVAANATAPIRVELKDDTGRASFAFHRRLMPSTTWVQVPASSLKPRLGLVTSATDADGHTVRTAYTGGSVSAVYGLPYSTTTETAPADLVESYEYETDFLRRTSRTLPGGPDTKVRYEHTDGTADSPCDSATGVHQGGRQTRAISATSGAPGDAITYESFYDDHGRAQGSTSGRFADVDAGATDWTCTSYDDRGRPTETDHPAFDGTPGRTVSYNHAVAGNPLVSSVTDPAGTITTKADLLGRVVSTTDVWGVITTTTYDAAGRAASSTVVAGSTSFTRATDYDAYSRPITHKLNGQPIAQVAFDDADRMTAVTYPSGTGNAGNGTSGAFTYSTSTGELNKSSWAQADSTLLTSDEVTSRWLTGRIRDQAVDGVDPNGATDNYTYDGAWRLTGATVARPGGTNSYTYGFAATGGCGDLTTAGANSNRTSKTITPSGGSPVATQYCYDNADRLTSTTDTSVGTLGYDDHGNTDTLGDETHVYDNANRHLSTTAPASGGGTTTVEYLRDATDRIVQRKVNGTVEARYAHSASGDTPTLALDASNAVTGASLALPGGALYKWLPSTPAASLWEYPNLQGSLVATATQAGVKVGTRRVYDPDGNSVIGTTPDTGPGDFDYGWLGGHQRPLEHHGDLQSVVQMGARQYHPQLGRFLEVDPVEGGVRNDYGYVPDPVNSYDLDGTCESLPKWARALGQTALSPHGFDARSKGRCGEGRVWGFTRTLQMPTGGWDLKWGAAGWQSKRTYRETIWREHSFRDSAGHLVRMWAQFERYVDEHTACLARCRYWESATTWTMVNQGGYVQVVYRGNPGPYYARPAFWIYGELTK